MLKHKLGGSVPFTHSLHAFNCIIPDNDPKAKLSADWINEFYKTKEYPPFPIDDDGINTGAAASSDPLYGDRKIYYRNIYNSTTRITIFDGGHEILHVAALNWLNQQQRRERTTKDIDHPPPVVWDIPTDTALWMDRITPQGKEEGASSTTQAGM